MNFGVLTSGAVATSDGSTYNSVFLTATSNATGGVAITVNDANNGLKRATTADTIPSSTATLVAGTAGYGVCVFSATQDGGSPTALTKSSPYNGTCTKSTGHAVGAVSTSPATILSSTGQLLAGEAEVLVKASIGAGTAAGPDYEDTLTFIATGTY